jgi:hypothetical protein
LGITEISGEFASECPGYCGAQDTFYVGTLKGVCGALMPPLRSTRSTYFAFTDISITATGARSILRADSEQGSKRPGVESLIFTSITVP